MDRVSSRNRKESSRLEQTGGGRQGSWEAEAGSGFVGLGKTQEGVGSYFESMPERRLLSNWARKATKLSL